MTEDEQIKALHGELLERCDGEDLTVAVTAAMGLLASLGAQGGDAVDWTELYAEVDRMRARAGAYLATIESEDPEDGLMYLSLPHGVGDA